MHDLHIWSIGQGEVALTAHLVMPDKGLSDNDFERVNTELFEKFSISHTTLQVEKGDLNYRCRLSEKCY